MGERRKFFTFCDFALVQNTIAPSTTRYHIATRWMLPSAFSEASDRVRCCRKNASISSSDILTCARRFTPLPIR